MFLFGACFPVRPSSLGQACDSNSAATCWGPGETCTNGYCQVQSGGCPGSCQNNWDCRGYANCGDKLLCKNGQCVADTQACPSTCNVDSDCSNCPDQKNKCANNQCVKLGGETCPAACTNNADCAIAACGKNTECGRGGTCAPPIGPLCNQACAADTDCQSVACKAANRTTCTNSRCTVATPSTDLTCTDNSDCPNGLLCGTGEITGVCTTTNCMPGPNSTNSCSTFQEVTNAPPFCLPSPGQASANCVVDCKLQKVCGNYGLKCCRLESRGKNGESFDVCLKTCP